MEKKELDIFGKKIEINAAGTLVKVLPSGTDHVVIQIERQDGLLYQNPIDTQKEYNVTPEEFINEFERQNAFATKTPLSSFGSERYDKFKP